VASWVKDGICIPGPGNHAIHMRRITAGIAPAQVPEIRQRSLTLNMHRLSAAFDDGMPAGPDNVVDIATAPRQSSAAAAPAPAASTGTEGE
jgi:hypothetical protein